jgi:hypothetical protein
MRGATPLPGRPIRRQRAEDKLHKFAHGSMPLDRVAQMHAAVEFIAIAAAAAPAPQIANLFEIGDDALDGALGDADLCGHVAQPHRGFTGQA